jgi:hypothetical protein
LGGLYAVTHRMLIMPNARPEWRGAKRVDIQTGRAIPRPLQAAC